MPAKSETAPGIGETLKALRRGKTEKMALYLSNPDIPKIKGVVGRSDFEVGFEIVYRDWLNAPAESFSAYIDRRRAIRASVKGSLGRFIRAVISPDKYPQDERDWAKELFEKIKTQNSNPDMKPADLYVVLGIEPLKKPKTSPHSPRHSPASSPLSAPPLSETPPLSQSVDPQPEEENIGVFVEHLLFTRANPLREGAEYIGKKSSSQPTPPSPSSLNTREE